MSEGRTPLVVVGIDGSAEAAAALRFAVEEAALRDARLRIVCAWEPSTSAYAGEAFAATPDVFLESEHHAEDLLRAALEQVPAGDVAAEAVAEEGRPATVLLEQSEGADLLVVGSRARGAAKRLLLGSVGHDLAHHTRCPLVIVPSHE
jgi:nucleotide-binding universal stress UspA family protein